MKTFKVSTKILYDGNSIKYLEELKSIQGKLQKKI